MTLTAQQRHDFHERGWFNLGPVFDPAELTEIGTAYDTLLAQPLRLGEKGKGKFDYNPLLQLQSPVLCRYATSPKLVAPMIELLGPDVRLYWDQAVSKPPGATSDVPWHQDNGYTPVDPEQYVTCTLALDHMRLENGCLWIQPGSHRRGTQPHRQTDFFFYVGYDGAEPGEPVQLDAGDVLVFSSLTMHRSGPNCSTSRRRSWVIQFCHGHARHRDTQIPFTDRLLVARDGQVLDQPYRERELNLFELAKGYR
jgi:ectoine hydroxylase-related dioxygenase (phytanoyl-CoA dioxygenase family)